MKRFRVSAVSLVLTALVTLLLLPAPSGAASDDASPVFGVKIPKGYRDFKLIATSHRTDNKDELRAILGNDIAMKAYRTGKLPFPDGAILAKLAWKREPMKEFDGAWKPGEAPRIEFMVKNAKKYAKTGGWGFGRFVNGKAADEAAHNTCFPCHEANVKDHDFVFTRYAP